jgi:hypothetical protein
VFSHHVSNASRDWAIDDINPTLACFAYPGAAPPRSSTTLDGALGSAFTGCHQGPDRRAAAAVSPRSFGDMPLEEAVDYIVDECFFTVGQAVGDRKSLDVAAVIWWRDHYRRKFLTAMKRFGNRWLLDERNVKGVGRLLAERAVAYAGESPSIDEASAMKAAADAERYCTLHFMRRARHASDQLGQESTWIAGYWCGEGIPPFRA